LSGLPGYPQHRRRVDRSQSSDSGKGGM